MKIELLEDGTLFVETPVDMGKVKRVMIADENSQYGDLFYPDETKEVEYE